MKQYIVAAWHMDPSHGWLAVYAKDVKALGLREADFSCYSYKRETDTKGAIWYLEEDCDAYFLIKAAEKAGVEIDYLPEQVLNEESPVRSYERLAGESLLFNDEVKIRVREADAYA